MYNYPKHQSTTFYQDSNSLSVSARIISAIRNRYSGHVNCVDQSEVFWVKQGKVRYEPRAPPERLKQKNQKISEKWLSTGVLVFFPEMTQNELKWILNTT